MAKDFLLELGLEEVPARFIPGAIDQLSKKFEEWLNASRISYESLEAYATPRRLALNVTGMVEKQEDMQEEAKGPAKKIALDADGQWTKAALGFARGQGVDPDQLYMKEINGVEYVHAVKNSIGLHTKDLLAKELTAMMTGLHFPKNMRWNQYELKFVRPIRWMVVLFGEEIVPIEITGVTSGNQSEGHRFLGKPTAIEQPSVYTERLAEQKVIVNQHTRQEMILEQIDQLSKEQGWRIDIDEGLLEEIVHLVEYPTVLYGTFETEFLTIPQEVLITSMREHQRYFPVKNNEGQLLPYFVTVRNGDDRNLAQVAKGNEKVLRARLSDARFFYEEDQKLSIDTALQKLEKVVFHEELGTIGDKVRRVRSMAKKIARALDLNPEQIERIKRTANICKFDLVTQMVYEFPELQGVMGADYAGKAGEEEEVAQAIFEHYQPRFSGDASPASITGAVVSVADKLDTLAGCFSIGIIPTGSQDPYALRRQAAGIVQILQDHNLAISLSGLFAIASEVLQEAGLAHQSAETLNKELTDFFGLRVKNVLSDAARYDVVDAVMAAGYDHIGDVIGRTKALSAAVQGDDWKGIAEAFNRVSNLAAKAEHDHVSDEYLETSEEQALAHAWRQAAVEFESFLQQGKQEEALQVLSEMTGTIHQFFENVMVMAEDQAVRENRLALLKNIASLTSRFADFKKLVGA
ncbi:glycine--tRNA ligase subunit beta [Marinicrinis sediminis]|uniref:Glycine--tRNA ligase beta subunit n=1 Tax=Marinicrinis sediminis TaxID=1652465 RepID=A0ABW5RBI5_9BACL